MASLNGLLDAGISLENTVGAVHSGGNSKLPDGMVMDVVMDPEFGEFDEFRTGVQNLEQYNEEVLLQPLVRLLTTGVNGQTIPQPVPGLFRNARQLFLYCAPTLSRLIDQARAYITKPTRQAVEVPTASLAVLNTEPLRLLPTWTEDEDAHAVQRQHPFARIRNLVLASDKSVHFEPDNNVRSVFIPRLYEKPFAFACSLQSLLGTSPFFFASSFEDELQPTDSSACEIARPLLETDWRLHPYLSEILALWRTYDPYAAGSKLNYSLPDDERAFVTTLTPAIRAELECHGVNSSKQQLELDPVMAMTAARVVLGDLLEPVRDAGAVIDYRANRDRLQDTWMEALGAGLTAGEITGVDTTEGLEALVADLEQGDLVALAFDLEHASHVSFHGVTCLLQLTAHYRLSDGTVSPGKTYLVDTLALRGQLHRLRAVFADPTVLKIAHDARMDVQWLERDCRLFVIGLWDTSLADLCLSDLHQGAYSTRVSALYDSTEADAAALISSTYPKHEGEGDSIWYSGGSQFRRGLGVLVREMSHSALEGTEQDSIVLNKDQQMSDWSLRPLLRRQVQYAACDTRFLYALFCTQALTLLTERSPNFAPDSVPVARTAEIATRVDSLIRVLGLCKDNSLIVYHGPTPLTVDKLLDSRAGERARGILGSNPQRREAVAAVLQWRDATARVQDVALETVATIGLILRVAQNYNPAQTALADVLGEYRGTKGRSREEFAPQLLHEYTKNAVVVTGYQPEQTAAEVSSELPAQIHAITLTESHTYATSGPEVQYAMPREERCTVKQTSWCCPQLIAIVSGPKSAAYSQPVVDRNIPPRVRNANDVLFSSLLGRAVIRPAAEESSAEASREDKVRAPQRVPEISESRPEITNAVGRVSGAEISRKVAQQRPNQRQQAAAKLVEVLEEVESPSPGQARPANAERGDDAAPRKKRPNKRGDRALKAEKIENFKLNFQLNYVRI